MCMVESLPVGGASSASEGDTGSGAGVDTRPAPESLSPPVASGAPSPVGGGGSGPEAGTEGPPSPACDASWATCFCMASLTTRAHL